MANQYHVGVNDGRNFDLSGDKVTIKTSATDTGGAYSLMHWIVTGGGGAPYHVHEKYEETFYVLAGSLDFTLGHETVQVGPGDLIRAPAGTRHAYCNRSDSDPVEMLVVFTPGGIEELFYKYRDDGADPQTYVLDAKDKHHTEYEFGS